MARFVLVPGAMHCAAHFGKLAALLRAEGMNQVVAVELPGLDKAAPVPADVAFEVHVAAVMTAVDAAGGPVVLVGHSTAGRIISAVAEQRVDAILKLVFLAAETLPGPMSFSLEPVVDWAAEGLMSLEQDGKLMVVSDGKEDRMGEILYCGATDVDRKDAVQLLRPCPVYAEGSVQSLKLNQYWRVPKAYIKCLQDLCLLPVHQDTMFARLREGALRFELDSGHCPFISCPDKLAAMLLEIEAMPALQFRPMRQICESAWQDQAGAFGIQIKLLEPLATSDHAASKNEVHVPPPKRPHVPPPACKLGQEVAYRISKSRRDSTLVKVLKFPVGAVVGAPAFYWYDSFVDDPAQYTNSSLNVPERGHEPPLDVAGISRSLCAEGIVLGLECSRASFVWQKVVTKVHGDSWTEASTEQVWGIDGREWNGSYADASTGRFVENLNKYTKGSADAFWEDVPKKAADLLAKT